VLLLGILHAQQTGYYNGVEGKDGEELKAQLNDIISGHTVYSYFFSKEIFKLSDQDPDNPNNVITVYSGFSRPNDDYGTGGDFLNREHVWAKSHGTFEDILPMDSDVHNLKPADASVNVSRSNKDFDNGGTQHPEATDCYFTDDTWEPRDGAKGDIARIIFYMATRYEGENGEMDLEVVDEINTYPNPTHGKLSTLLEWNMQDPPDAFERNRNNVIYSFQQNRNPFIDNPEFANLIWRNVAASPISIANVQIMPETAVANQEVTIAASISSSAAEITSAKIMWGLSYENLSNEIVMAAAGNQFTAVIPGQAEDQTVYYKIIATDGTNENSTVVYNYYIPKVFTGQLVSIFDIQGQTENSPYIDQIVSTSGIVTGSFGSFYFIQDGTGLWNGMYIYDGGRNPSIGDSVIVTGKVKEYYGKTEIAEVSDFYFIADNKPLPEPVIVRTGEVEEGHESILVKVMNATCVMENYQSNFFMWWVDDGSGVLKVHNTSIFEYEPELNAAYDITGPMNFDFDEWKIELRFETDVASGSDIVLPQVMEVTPLTFNNIRIDFSEDVTEESAENIANYSLDNGISVIAANQHTFNKKQVNLEVSGMTSGTDYTLNIQGVKDLTDNEMEPFETTFNWVAIGEISFISSSTIYPNPADNFTTITLVAEKNETINIALYDIGGRLVYHNEVNLTFGSNSFTIDTNPFNNGFYQLKISNDSGRINHKLIIY
jgi:endonuclease I